MTEIEIQEHGKEEGKYMYPGNRNVFVTLEKKIAMLMLIFGSIMMFLIPTWQVPDEYTHLNIIGNSIKNEEFAEIIASNVDINGSRMITHYEEKVDIEELKAALFGKSEYNKDELMPRGISLSIVKHLPATLGILVGIVLGLPAYWVLQLGEFFSLLFYVCVCYFALKIMPIKKEMFAIILLMPIALQQAGGIGYDAVLIPLCFYWIAYVLYLKFKEEIHLKDILNLILLWCIITYIKVPYCFLILLILILPLEKMHFQLGKIDVSGMVIKRYRLLVFSFASIMTIIVLYFMRNNFWIQLVVGLIKEWRRTLYLLESTGKNWGGSLITSSVGNFGWLDTPIVPAVAILVYIIIAITAMVNSDMKEEKMLTTRDKLIVWGTMGILCLFTVFAMVNHTIMITLYGSESASETYNIQTALYQIPYIGGLQGRYFLPYVSLLFLPLPQLKQVNAKKVGVVVPVFEIVLFAYIVYVLLARYWFV